MTKNTNAQDAPVLVAIDIAKARQDVFFAVPDKRRCLRSQPTGRHKPLRYCVEGLRTLNSYSLAPTVETGAADPKIPTGLRNMANLFSVSKYVQFALYPALLFCH